MVLRGDLMSGLHVGGLRGGEGTFSQEDVGPQLWRTGRWVTLLVLELQAGPHAIPLLPSE